MKYLLVKFMLENFKIFLKKYRNQIKLSNEGIDCLFKSNQFDFKDFEVNFKNYKEFFINSFEYFLLEKYVNFEKILLFDNKKKIIVKFLSLKD